ncbi:MAG: TIGR02449 family protein [Oleiphilaceae bacterium]|nr:TIGR02449 family protein [Oleiphilaceae bacterium]
MNKNRLSQFSDKVDQLLAYCHKLEADNAALRELQEDWQNERARLLQKNDLARNKIEAMIGRLKALEQS